MGTSIPNRYQRQNLPGNSHNLEDAEYVAELKVEDVRLLLTGDVGINDLSHTMRFVAHSLQSSMPVIHERRLHIERVENFDSVVEVVRETCAFHGERTVHMDRSLDVYYNEILDISFLVKRGENGSISFAKGNKRALTVEQTCTTLPRLLHWFVIDMLRGIRERHGAISLHAAALGYKGTGVMLLGPSGSGKTTTLLHLLSVKGATLLCNDRVSVDPHNLRMYHAPLPVRLGWGCAAHWAPLQEWLDRRQDDTYQVLRDKLIDFQHGGPSKIRTEFGARSKVALAPCEISELTGAPLAASTQLDVIIVPKLQVSASPGRTRRLSRNEVLLLLCSECRTPIDNVWPEQWLEKRTTTKPASSNIPFVDALRRIAAVPAFEIEFDVGRRPSKVATLLENCLATS